MNPVFLLGVVLLAGAVVYFVLQPILAGRRAPMGQADGEMTDAEAKRRVSLLALRDVEYDRETGKLDEHDYRELKRELSTEALAALSDEQAERRAREDGPANGALAVGGGGTRVLDLRRSSGGCGRGSRWGRPAGAAAT